MISLDDEQDNDEERADRRMWNMDLLAGYSLEERVRREILRRTNKDRVQSLPDAKLFEALASDASEGTVHSSSAGVTPIGFIAEDRVTEGRPRIEGTSAASSSMFAAVESDLTADELTDARRGAVQDISIPAAAGLAHTPVGNGQFPLADDLDLESTHRIPAPIQAEDDPSRCVTPMSVMPVVANHRAVDVSSLPTPPSRAPTVHPSQTRMTRASQSAASERLVSAASDFDERDVVRLTEEDSPVVRDSDSPVLRHSDSVEPPELSAVTRAAETVVKSTPIDSPPSLAMNRSSLMSLPEGHPLDTQMETAAKPSGTPKYEEDQTNDIVLDTSPFSRKLTRGKAIRRSSSGTKSSPSIPRRTSSKRLLDPLPPLFSSANYAFSSPMLEPNSSDLPRSPTATGEESVDTLAEPTPEHRFVVRRTSGGPITDHTPRELSDQLQKIPQSQPRLVDPGEAPLSAYTTTLPPHREAAMRRRDLALFSVPTESKPSSEIKTIKAITTPSGLLIDLSKGGLSGQMHDDLPALASSTADLLQLLQEEMSPVAESSTQAAARVAVSATPPPLPPRSKETSRPISISAIAPMKTAPSPMISPLRTRTQRQDQDGLSRKPSVLSTANSPITPRPINLVIPSDTSPTPRARAPIMATRRPPPPLPPIKHDESMAIAPLDETDLTLLNLRAPPPAFEPRPTFNRADSSFSHSTTSSISEKPSNVALPVPMWSSKPRVNMLSRPRGPRPPPPPPRPWAKIVAANLDVEREPLAMDHHAVSEFPLEIDTSNEESVRSLVRSASSQDLVSQASVPRSPEYTDLDVLVSRIESSGREYEVCPIASCIS